ncbi:class I SAM-dependent methyltransferase [Methanoregula sp.]|uniref:class I SAM-dependent methyltransferase n=1 Tax=Methanoregula sp. TaxID=2052170 RepID=UPI003563B519
MIDHEIRDAIRKSWNQSSVTYDSCPGHGIGTEEEKSAWKQELQRNLSGSRQAVLDVGCGTGAMGLLFAEMGHRVTALDLSEGMMAQALKKGNAQNNSIELVAGDAGHLPFRDGSFDVVVNRHLLWTLPHPETALSEWRRVLKNGGVVLIIEGVWTDRRFPARAKRWLSNGLAKIFGHTHGGHYDKELRSQLPYDGGVPKEAMISGLSHAGFVNISIRDLMYIREIQKSQIPWYQRFAPAKTYYLLAATKHD